MELSPGSGLAELRWAPYQEFGAPDQSAETEEAPPGFILIGSIGYRANVIIIYWMPGLSAVDQETGR
jgi:hypothetical protein